MTNPIRSAIAGDVPAAAQVLADAFNGSPWTRWTVAQDDHSRRLRGLHATYLTDVALPYGRVDVIEIAGTGIGAVAAWIPGDAVPDDVWQRVAATVVELAGERAAAADEAEALLAPHRPTFPHVTLATIGVSPHLQGGGLGTTLLEAGLRAIDRGELPAYLETSDPRNVRLYEHHGFLVTAATDLPDGGPRTWSMLRPAGRA
jgi:ribosomal protein S18 acetylase RimI-like enzyme